MAFVASRLVTLVAAFAARYTSPGTGVLKVLTDTWDSDWYLAIARDGYPSVIPAGEGNAAQSPLGFFPLYPLVARAADAVLPGDLRIAAVVVNLVAGAVATVLVWRLADVLFGRDTADRTAFLFAFFPGSYALSLAYSEALFIALAAGCLLLLHRRRWWWAALVGGIGSAARPTGYALAVCCAFAVVLHWRRTRQWRPLLSPALAAGGFLAFLAYLQARTGNALAYQRVQERGWGQRIDGGGATVRRLFDALQKPDDLNLVVPSAAVLCAVVLVVLLVRARPPGTLLVFTVATLLPGVLTRGVATTPRHLFVAFPLVIGLARACVGNVYACVLALGAAALALFMFLIGGTFALTP